MCDLAGMLFGRKRDHEPINDIKNGYIISRGEKKRCDGYLPKNATFKEAFWMLRFLRLNKLAQSYKNDRAWKWF